MSGLRLARMGSDRVGAPERGVSGRARDADLVVVGLDAALGARGPSFHASTAEVSALAAHTAAALGLVEDDQALVALSARVRDVGMLALPDGLVLSTGSPSAEHWALLGRHPMIGAEMLRPLPGSHRRQRFCAPTTSGGMATAIQTG